MTAITPYDTVEYIACFQDYSHQGESMEDKAFQNNTSRLKLLWRQSKVLDISTRKFMPNSLTQYQFD